MSKMIERVARALMEVKALRPGSDPAASREMPVLSLNPDFDDLPADGSEGTADDEITQEAVLRLARAAIEAMREPTDKMRRAGWEKLREKNDIQTRLGNSLVGVETPVYEAMINEALK